MVLDSHYANLVEAAIKELRSRAQGFHVHGSYCKAALRSVTQADRPVASTPHGAILEPSACQLRQPERESILFFGRMEAYKGLDVLLDAVEILRGSECNVRLVLAGRGPELTRLTPRIREIPNVEIIDQFVPPKDAAALFQRCALGRIAI